MINFKSRSCHGTGAQHWNFECHGHLTENATDVNSIPTQGNYLFSFFKPDNKTIHSVKFFSRNISK